MRSGKMSASPIFFFLLSSLLSPPSICYGGDPRAPDYFRVSFGTTVVNDATTSAAAEPIVMEVNRSWAPIGADRFYALIADHYYDDAAFFRVVPDFVVQWGIAALPNETKEWDTPIEDDPVLVSNLPGTVTYAAAAQPNTRTTQIFINYADNSQLDASGFAPFARVVSGMATAEAIVNPTPGDSNGISQPKYTYGGNAWLVPHYPNATLVTTACFVDEKEAAAATAAT